MEAISEGKVITFYSYKGGTGRSMALANVAWILASSGKKVLVIDWDLEAPGLHRYFYPFLIDQDLISSDGLIDFFIDFEVEAATPNKQGEEPNKHWYKAHADISRYAASLDWEFPNEGALDFIPAGRQGVSYASRVNSFNWQEFYDRLGGGVFLEAVRENLKAEYDYILVDSRTGVSDTSGICTVQLPDILVVCFTLNYQSIEGAAAVASSAWKQRRKSDLLVFPVPMRIENAEKDKLEQRREYARKSFAQFPNHLLSGEKDKYWGEVEVTYIPYYAYEELLAPFGDKVGQTSSLLSSAERLTSYLASGEALRLTPPPEYLRQEILAKYVRKTPEVDSGEDLIRTAERTFQTMSAEYQAVAQRVLTRLVRRSRPGELAEDARLRVKVNDWSESAREVIDEMASAGLLVSGRDDSTEDETIELADDTLIRNWERMKGWLNKDRQFLLWRQQLQATIAEWETNGRDEGGLLSGAPLRIAKRWRHDRSEYLDKPEMLYINESARLARREISKRIAVSAVAFILSVLSVLGVLQWRAYQRMLENTQLSTEHIRIGTAYLSNKNYDNAISEFDSAIEAKPDSDNAYYNRGLARYQKGAFGLAVEDFTEAIRLKDSFVEAYIQRGRTYRQQNEVDKAIEDYNKAINIRPDSAEAYNYRGFAYSTKGQYDKALEDCKRAIELSPRDASAHDSLGSIYLGIYKTSRNQDDLERALLEFNMAIKVNPGFEFAYLNRGRTYYEKGDLARAIADDSQAIELKPEYAEAFLNRGLAYSAKDDVEKAIADYNQAIELKPDYADAYFARGEWYANRKNKALAIKEFTHVISIDPKYAAAYYQRGWNEYLGHKYESAIEDFSQAIDLNPNNTDSHFGLAEAHFNRGRAQRDNGSDEAAIPDIQRALELPHDAVMQDVGSRILLKLNAKKQSQSKQK